jgi:hypothetical protein
MEFGEEGYDYVIGCPLAFSAAFLLRELAEHIAIYLDVTSLGRMLSASKELGKVPSLQRVWRALVEGSLFEKQRRHAELPFQFDYLKYCREKLIWKYPLNWDRVRPLDHPSSRSRSGVSRLGDKIILVGGHVRFGDFVRENDIWCFDTNTENFEKIEPAAGKEPPKISRLCLESYDDKIYSFGGILQNKKKINTIYSFDLHSREWREIQASGTPPSGRCDPLTSRYSCGDKNGILVFGGSQEGLIFPSDVHFFNIGNHTWEPVHIDGAPPSDRIGSCAAIIGDKFYLYGGAFWNKETATYSKNYHEMWCLHLGRGIWWWEQLPSYGDCPTGAPVNLTAVPIGNHILIEGSMSCNGSYLYDTVTYTWSKLSPKTTTNDANYGSATLVGDTVYYLCGYRAHSHARDVIKLSLTSVLDFVNTGRVPDYLKESNSGEPMEEEEMMMVEGKLVHLRGSIGSEGEIGVVTA